MKRIAFAGLLVAGASLSLLSGCVSSNITGSEQLSADNVKKITKGVTTKAEVVALLGEPYHVTLLPDGRRAMTYMAVQSSGDKSGTITRSIIPFVALFPTSDTDTTRTQILQISLGANNVVQDFEYSDNTSEMKTTASAFGANTQQSTTSNDPAK